MRHILSKKSLETLHPVHPDLYAVVRLAIVLTNQDFCVFEGLRTIERQKQLLAKADGTTKTLRSRHLTGHAVDLVPWIDGKPQWDREGCLVIRNAMFEAAEMLGVPLRW